jgi:probable F420-dependent oxidoreductase
MPFDRPAARLGEYIGALRAIWRSFGGSEPLRFEGEFYRHTLLTPFFNPGPIAHPEIPVHVAGVGGRLARLAGELCDGFHVHPFHTPKYVRETLRPAIAEGAEGAGREPGAVELVTSVFVVTGGSREEISRHREEMRAQIAFYASTPTYRPVLETHGWSGAGERLSVLAREGKWRELPALVTDEMLHAFAVEAAPEELGPALRERYDGLVDRLFPYVPFVPGERDDLWRTLAGSFD